MKEKIEFLELMKKLLNRTSELYEFTVEYWFSRLIVLTEVTKQQVQVWQSCLVKIFDCDCIITDVQTWEQVIVKIDLKIIQLKNS